MKYKSFVHVFPAFFLTITILVLWQVLAQFGLINQHTLPAPISVLSALIDNWDVIAMHSAQTLQEAFIGLVIATGCGLIVAILLDRSTVIKKAVYPLLITSQTIPIITLAPLLLLWFGFDMLPKIIIVVLSCFFPITIATISGFAQTDEELIKLLKSMKANYWQILWMVKFPGALPQFFSGLKIAATYSVTGAMVGEYVGAYQGLGIYMQEMAHAHALTLVFAIILVTAILSFLLVGLVVLLERLLLPWNQK